MTNPMPVAETPHSDVVGLRGERERDHAADRVADEDDAGRTESIGRRLRRLGEQLGLALERVLGRRKLGRSPEPGRSNATTPNPFAAARSSEAAPGPDRTSK